MSSGQQDRFQSKTFQYNILSMMLHDKRLGRAYGRSLNLDDFEGFALRWLASAIASFVDDFGSPPSFDDLSILLDTSIDNGEVKSNQIDYIEKGIKRLRKIPQNLTFLEMQLKEFLRQSKIDSALLEISYYRKLGDFGAVETTMRQTVGELQVGTDMTVGTMFFHVDDVERRTRYRLADRGNAIPTGTPIDEYLDNGGLNLTELGCFIAPPNRGKTMALIHVAKVAVNRGKTVVFYTLEMSETALTKRFEVSIFGKAGKNRSALNRKIATWWRRNSDLLTIKKLPVAGTTVAAVEQHLDILKDSRCIIPDLICIDYGDLLDPTQKQGSGHEDVKQVYKELKGLTESRETRLWTASQTNRGSLKRRIITMADIADGWDKAKISDILIALCQEDAEKEDDIMRLYIAKNKEGRSGIQFKIQYDFTRSQFCLGGGY